MRLSLDHIPIHVDIRKIVVGPDFLNLAQCRLQSFPVPEADVFERFRMGCRIENGICYSRLERNLFDVIQIIENSRITGILSIESSNASGRIYFNFGQIADAQAGDSSSTAAFRLFVDVCDGVFEMEKSPVEFKQNIKAPNNTNLILDVLREIDEQRRNEELSSY